MDGSFVAKLKKSSNVVSKLKGEDLNGDQGDDESNDEVPIEESNELAIENISEEERKGDNPQGETSSGQSVTQDVKGSAKKRRRKNKRKSESSQAETSPEKTSTEDVKSPAKKRKMKEDESECSQVETSPDKSVTEGVETPKKKKKRRKKKKAMVTESSGTSEVLTSPNSVSPSDKTSMQVKDKAKKRKLEQTHTDDEASPLKERRLAPSGLTRAQKRRRNRKRNKQNKQKLAEGGQEVKVTASGKVPSVAQEKTPENRIPKENQSSATFSDKLASKKAKRQRKKKKIAIPSEKPNGDGSLQPLDTSVEAEVVPGGKKKKKRRKKKLANGSVAETTGDSVPQREWESGDVGHSATSKESQVSKESKPQVKAVKLKGKLMSKRVTLKRSVANRRLKKQKIPIVSIPLDKPVRLLIANG